MTTTNAIGNHVAGRRAETAIRTVEALLANPPRRRVPASFLLNQIAQDALAAALRDDAEAVANLPVRVQFRAIAVPSRTRIGRWRLIVIAQACGAWGHYTSGLINSEGFARGVAEMINGPAPVPAAPKARLISRIAKFFYGVPAHLSTDCASHTTPSRSQACAEASLAGGGGSERSISGVTAAQALRVADHSSTAPAQQSTPSLRPLAHLPDGEGKSITVGSLAH